MKGDYLIGWCSLFLVLSYTVLSQENIVNMLNQPNNCTIYEVVVRKFLCRRYSAYPPIPIQIVLTKAEG